MTKIAFLISIGIYLNCNAQTIKNEWVTSKNNGCKIMDSYYSNGVSFTWEGACINGYAIGYGNLTKYIDGTFESLYEGKLNYGKREGNGKFTHKDGSIKIGYFRNNQLTGKGEMYLKDGIKYKGDFLNYRIHGNGILEYPNGSKFEGFFVSDQIYTGKFRNFDGKETFIQKTKPVEKIVEIFNDYKPEIGKKLTEYFDQNWNRCNQNLASYFRVITYESPNKPKGLVQDYYISGQLQSEFFAEYLDYNDEGKNFHEGKAVWYHKNGQLEQIRYYYNNKLNGKNTFFYENGEISSERTYSFGVLNGPFKRWSKTGKLQLYAEYENGELINDKYLEFDENGLGSLVYNEDFQKNKEEWEQDTEDGKSILTYENKISLNHSKDISSARYNYIPLNQDRNYSIESTIQKKTGKNGEGYGMIFGFKDWDNYYQFLISEFGAFLIYGKFEGVNVKICEWTKSNSINIKNSRNLLKLLKIDDEFIFSINGEVVFNSKSKVLRGNNFGIIANGKGEFLLENILIKEFLSNEELEKRIPENNSDLNNEWKGNGSGFFINEKGYIATNYHVVKDAVEIQIEFIQNGLKKTYSAKVIVTDKQNDLAIIQINDPKFISVPTIPYVFTTNLKDVGTDVFTMGYPIAQIMGDEIKFTDGKISSKTGIGGDITKYQISVPIQPGNSGGPLFDNNGNLVGITSAGLNREYFKSENVNYAIKTTYLKNLIDVMPEKIRLPNYLNIIDKPLTEKIKLLSSFIPIIRIK